ADHADAVRAHVRLLLEPVDRGAEILARLVVGGSAHDPAFLHPGLLAPRGVVVGHDGHVALAGEAHRQVSHVRATAGYVGHAPQLRAWEGAGEGAGARRPREIARHGRPIRSHVAGVLGDDVHRSILSSHSSRVDARALSYSAPSQGGTTTPRQWP